MQSENFLLSPGSIYLEAKLRLIILVVNGDELKCFDSLTQQDTLTTSFFFSYLPSNFTHELQKLDEAKDQTDRIFQI
jgi:hypothetical protein